jgi:hypothetical protein
MSPQLRRPGGRLYDAVAAILAVIVCVVATGPTSAQPAASAVTAGGDSPLTLQVLAQPHAVTGSDGNRHLVYELMLRNTSPTTFDATDVRIVNLKTRQAIADFSSTSVRLLIDPPPAPRRSRIGPGDYRAAINTLRSPNGAARGDGVGSAALRPAILR